MANQKPFMGGLCDKPVGQPTVKLNVDGGGNDLKNWHAHTNMAAGVKVWENTKGNVDVGVAGHYGQTHGKFGGHAFKSQPNYGASVGARFHF